MEDYAEDFSPELESNDDLMSEEDEAGSASDREPDPEPEVPPTEETVDGSETMKDLIDTIGDLNETITGAVTQEPEELPAGGEGGEGGFGGESQVTESASVDLAPVVQVLERNEKLLTRTTELLEQQGEVLVMQHNDLLQLQANVDFVFLAVAALIGVVLGGFVALVIDRIWRG